MAGLIETTIKNGDGNNNDFNSFVGMEADKLDVDPKSTVQQQLADITAKGTPLDTIATTRAKQDANKRGLINSAMAVSAGEKALLETALPIAQQDAGTYYSAQQGNQQAENRAREVTVDATNKAADIQARTVSEGQLRNLSHGHDMELQTLRGTQQERLDQIAAQNQRILQTSQSAALIYSQAQQAMANILANTDIDNTAKQAMLDQMNGMLSSQIALISSFGDVDVGSLLSFDGYTPPASGGNTGQQPAGGNAGQPGAGTGQQSGSGTGANTSTNTAQPVSGLDSLASLKEYIKEAKTNAKFDPNNPNETSINKGEAGTIAKAAAGLNLSPEQIAELTGAKVEDVTNFIKSAYPNDLAGYINQYGL